MNCSRSHYGHLFGFACQLPIGPLTSLYLGAFFFVSRGACSKFYVANMIVFNVLSHEQKMNAQLQIGSAALSYSDFCKPLNSLITACNNLNRNIIIRPPHDVPPK